MRSIIDLKKDFEVTNSLGDIVDVIKTATLIQFRLLQSREKPLENFSQEAEYMFSDLKIILEENQDRHPFFYLRGNMPSLILIVSSEEGFLGEINTLLINAAIAQRWAPADEIVMVGERGARYLEGMQLDFTFFHGLTDEIAFDEVERIGHYLLEAYRKRVSRIIIVYPAFISLMYQKITIWQGLPYQHSGAVVDELRRDMVKDMLVEPSAKRAMEGAVELWFHSKLLQIFWSSKLAEYAARIMHLEGSGQELTHRREELSKEYFRQVHAIRDKGIREITASRKIAGER